MSFRAARQTFSTAARSSFRTARPNVSSFRIGGRRMNSSHAPAQSSDKTWIIASTLIFGPAFLYLISPSARKNTDFAHNDAHDFPGYEKKSREVAKEAAKEPEPIMMKDDEGTEANVAQSIQQAETADVPQADAAPATESETEPEATPAEDKKDAAEVAEADSEADKKEPADASGTFQESGESGPTDMGAARQAAAEGVPPKKAEEQSSS